MKTLQRRQTIAPLAQGGLRLSALKRMTGAVRSPYFQPTDMRKGHAGRDINLISLLYMIKAFVIGYLPAGAHVNVDFFLKDSANVYTACANTPLSITTSDTDATIMAAIPGVITTWCMNNIGVAPDAIEWILQGDTAGVPMYVNGVAKTGYSAATGTATVAGGGGVARFYLDSNNDGTGTALYSEVYANSVQAYVLNSSNVFIPSAVSVDGALKYVDITIKQQAFTGIQVVGINVLGSAALGAAANGTVINVLVIGKK